MGRVCFQAMPVSGVQGRREGLEAAYLRAARTWKNRPKGHPAPKPRKPQVRVWNVKHGSHAEQLARQAAAHYQRQHDLELFKNRQAGAALELDGGEGGSEQVAAEPERKKHVPFAGCSRPR